MARETQIAAYYEAKESGLLTKVRLRVYEILCFHGPMTALEMWKKSNHTGNAGVYTTRLSELERMGAVTTIEVRPCNVTGHNALVWEITGRMPIKLNKRVSKAEKKEEIFNKLKEIQKVSHPLFDLKFDSLKNLINEL